MFSEIDSMCLSIPTRTRWRVLDQLTQWESVSKIEMGFLRIF